jgi:CDP-paratose 2-epimerase
MMNILVIGGAGFIGCNVAEYYAKKGDSVLVLDNLSRKGTFLNLQYLTDKYNNVSFTYGDIRNYYDIYPVFKAHNFDVIFHMAAQVAVTTSVKRPKEDFDINALGTLNILEAMREADSKAMLIYASTNKVYGEMLDLSIVEINGRYQYRDIPEGISEKYNLDFHSPYGCSKGAADQYVIDYSRIYGLKTVVFRQSCIYGYHQFGIEDQGWVAWFTIAAAFGKKITIYGDGKQVRDVLFIDDLIEAYDLAVDNMEKVNGRAYNLGGGEFQMSLLELLAFLEQHKGEKISYDFSDWRPGDQKVYVSNNAKAKNDFNWAPQTSVQDGVKKLYRWVNENKEIFRKVGII